MSSMIRLSISQDDRGDINVLVVPLVLLILFFVIAAAFGMWAYSGRQDYKNNTDAKIATAVKVARQDEDIIKDKQHAESDKQPLKTYSGPEQYGSLRVSYPKTWSGYVLDTGNTNQPLDGYFQPGVVPSVSDPTSTFALRVQIQNQSYANAVTKYNATVTSGGLKASTYSLPKVPSVVGIRYEGTLDPGKKTTGIMVILPVRDKTLQIWTESPAYSADFNDNVLPNLTFSP